MNKQELEIAKKIAGIDGVEVEQYNDKLMISVNLKYCFAEYTPKEYNPFSWSILGPLMVKYEIEVDFVDSSVYIRSNEMSYKYWALFSCKEEIPSAILKCIIKSQGVEL